MSQYSDHLFQPSQPVNEISHEFIQKMFKKYDNTTKMRNASVLNAYKKRNEMMRAAGSNDPRDPRWSMLTRYGKAKQDDVDARHARRKEVWNRVVGSFVNRYHQSPLTGKPTNASPRFYQQ